MDKIKTVFLLGRYPNPRIKKRIKTEKTISKVALICWDKGSLNRLMFEDKQVDVNPISIETNITNPIKRILPTFLFIIKANRVLKRLSPTILHVENIDMLITALIYCLLRKKHVKIIYEVADLHRLIIDTHSNVFCKLFKKFLINIEKYACNYVDILVITSEKFFDVYYKNIISKSKVIFIPNMPDLTVFKNYKKKNRGKFTIGFIGGIRYNEQMLLLIDAAKNLDVNIIFTGFAFDNQVKDYCSNKHYVKFFGKYNYDKDISNLYGKIDCVYSVYNAHLNNVKVALPNKLYEAIFCELPIIVAKNTYLAELVEEMGVGVSVNHNDISELKYVIRKLSVDNNYYFSLVTSCKKHKKNINISHYNNLFLEKIENLFHC